MQKQAWTVLGDITTTEGADFCTGHEVTECSAGGRPRGW